MSVRPRVVVAVVGREQHPVVSTERVVSRVALVPGHLQLVLVDFAKHDERTVVGVAPRIAAFLQQVESQLVAAGLGKLAQDVVAEPVITSRVIEPNFKVGPRPVEEVRPVQVLLDQQRNALL